MFPRLVLTFLATLVILCTAIERYNQSFDMATARRNQSFRFLMFHRDTSYKPPPLIYSFSALTNTRALVSRRSRTSFASLETIKLFMILLLHLVHTYNYLATVGVFTLKNIFTSYPVNGYRSDLYSLFRMTLPYDVIIGIGGFTLGHNLVHASTAQTDLTKKRFNYLVYCSKLMVKYALTYAGSVLFLLVLPLTTSGPLWDSGMQWLNGCLDWRVVASGVLAVSNFNEQLGLGGIGKAVLPVVSSMERGSFRGNRK